jgi:transcription elongation factor GreA-like protein
MRWEAQRDELLHRGREEKNKRGIFFKKKVGRIIGNHQPEKIKEAWVKLKTITQKVARLSTFPARSKFPCPVRTRY